jgi:hypothetical protein
MQCIASVVKMAFSESLFYIDTSDNSNGGQGDDGLLSLNVVIGLNVTVPPAGLRGGFRYLKLIFDATCQINSLSVAKCFFISRKCVIYS